MLTQLIYGPGFNKMVRGRYGYVVYNKNDKFVGSAVQKYGEYSESEVELFRHCTGLGGVALDIGANIGTHTMALSKIVGNIGAVYAFEPQRIVFQNLCANMAVNSITNVHCYQVAVADSCGKCLIPEPLYDEIGNYGGVCAWGNDEGVLVDQITIDSLNLDTNKIDLIKIDVEGMETKVILGALETIAKHKPFLYVENDQIDKSKALIRIIKNMGYQPYWHTPYLFNENNYAEDEFNIYPGTVSVNMICVPNGVDFEYYGIMYAENNDFHPFK